MPAPLRTQKTAAKKPAQRNPESRSPIDATSARLANWVAKMTILKGSASSPNRLKPAMKERAFAQRPDGALRHRRKDGHQKIVEVLDVEAGSQPGEIVRAEPGGEAAPVKRQAEQRRDQPESGAGEPGRAWLRRSTVRHGNHLLSRPMFNTMMPSSRISAPLGAMALSNWKSMRTESPESSLAGTSRTYIKSPAVE